MYTWWATIRTQSGGYLRVTCQADNAFDATQHFRALYGDQLLTEYANKV